MPEENLPSNRSEHPPTSEHARADEIAPLAVDGATSKKTRARDAATRTKLNAVATSKLGNLDPRYISWPAVSQFIVNHGLAIFLVVFYVLVFVPTERQARKEKERRQYLARGF